MGIKAQDIIINNDNDTIYCKILDVNSENIRYQVQNEDRKTTSTINLKYIASYQINDNAPESNTTVVNNKKEPVFRIAAGGGYAGRTGEIQRTGDAQLDQLSKNLSNGYNLEGDAEYYFNWRQKDALNFAVALHFNYINHHVIGTNVNIPDYGFANRYEESQIVCYVAPAFVMRYDLPNWLFTLSVGLGPVFFTNPITVNYLSITGNSVILGSHFGIGADYKISPHWGIGLRLSAAGGSINSLNIGGNKVKFDKPMSVSSWMISGILSFRTK